MKSFIQRNVVLMLLAAVLAVLSVSYFVTASANNVAITTQKTELVTLEKKQAAKATAARLEQQGVMDEVSGTDGERIVADTAIITDFLRTVATWNSGADYTAAREKLERRYKLPADGQFMTVFFPVPVYNTDTSGKTFYFIDEMGLNSTLGEIDVKSLGVKGTAYSYMVTADIRSSSKDNKTSAGNSSIIFITVDGDGVISDVKGFASTADVRVSK